MHSIKTTPALVACLFAVVFARPAPAQEKFDVRANYRKREVSIPMRDGVKLFTSIYLPKDTSRTYPIMFSRTPYTVSPYGEDKYKLPEGDPAHLPLRTDRFPLEVNRAAVAE
jgi:predicted acyl esterase